jgi:L-ascorbate metabolism protein UlaG (beta-lactamase superfamily)
MALTFPQSDHCDGKRFFNPDAPEPKGLLDVLRWKMTSRTAPWTPGTGAAPQSNVPPASVNGADCRITFINHSTLLIQYAGTNLLTDPIWSERASPFSWLGPRRFSPPGVRFENLPKIDIVLLSHNHYDHLDLPTLTRVVERDKPRFIVPLGVTDLLSRNDIRVEEEMDWWDTAGSITCVPARHFSARGITDRNRTLWCGYWIETAAGPIYFAADTAFGPHFEEIRKRLGSPRIALLPIGAYKPEWFMSPVHMSPLQAVDAHRILMPERSMAIHWGTFQLADDGRDEPVVDLRKAMAEHPGLPPFEAVGNGEVIQIRQPHKV